MGSRQQAKIGPPEPGFPDAAVLALLERAEQQRLPPRRKLAHLVEEQGAPVRRLEQPRTGGVGAGEGAARVAEELRLQQAVGNRGAVHRHQRPRSPGAPVVEKAGQEFLPGAGLPLDQHRHIEAGDALRIGEQRPHRRRARDDARSGGAATAVRGRPHRTSP